MAKPFREPFAVAKVGIFFETAKELKKIFFKGDFLDCLWDFAPLVVFVGLIDCFIVFYVAVVCYASKLLKSLIMSVNNLLVIF